MGFVFSKSSPAFYFSYTSFFVYFPLFFCFLSVLLVLLLSVVCLVCFHLSLLPPFSILPQQITDDWPLQNSSSFLWYSVSGFQNNLKPETWFHFQSKCFACSCDRDLVATASYLHRSACIRVSGQVHMHIRIQLWEQNPLEADSPVAGQ